MDKLRFWKVTFFAALVLLMETVLFHVLLYLHEFFSATSVISYVVIGIGLGSFAASRIRASENVLFFWCSIGTTAAIYITSVVLVQYPVLWLVAAATALCVFFPVIYIAVLFREHPGGRVYFFDMVGAGLGIVAAVMLYSLLVSESIALLLTWAVPAVGGAVVLLGAGISRRLRIIGSLIALPLVAVGIVLFTMQITGDTFNIFRIFNRDAPHELGKVFKVLEPDRLVKSYDNLIDRIDVVTSQEEGKLNVCYSGYANDHFTTRRHPEYEWFVERGHAWPSGDQRVFYGLTDQPSIYIIGSAARGITETVKKITPAENILPVEINPAIVQIMARDFYEESGRAYRGLDPVIGDALALLKSIDDEFDIITLINTHSSRTIGHRSGPDYLHTLENYGLYLDNLSEDGFVLFEERPFTRGGMLGFYRMINTMWHTLKQRGVEDPSRHFLIWEWDAGRIYPRIDLRWDEETGRYRRAEVYYTGMIVTKNPLEGERAQKALDWFQHGVSICRISYFKGVMEWGEISDVFRMIETGDFSPLAPEGFDTRLVTNDLPFPSISTDEVPEIDNLLRSGVIVFLLLTVLFTLGAFRKSDQRRAAFLTGYNILIGFGYFLIEIMLLQIYANVFVSPSWSLVLVLGVLLISSGVGGMFTGRLKPWHATAALIPVSILTIYTPGMLLSMGIPSLLGKAFSVLLICATGFLMGYYFPRGLELASKWGVAGKIPHYFAINSVAGGFAVILALYFGVTIGYQATIIIAVLCYCAAGLMTTSVKE